MAKKKQSCVIKSLTRGSLNVITIGNKHSMKVRVLPEEGKHICDYDMSFVLAVIEFQSIHLDGIKH